MTHHCFTSNKEFELKKSLDKHQYHTLRYDFKPASVNSDQPANLELTQNGQVTIKAPNVVGSSSNYTVFKGQRRPHVKECLLVIDNLTGEMVLQKLTDNITVKATRALGGSGVPGPAAPANNNNNNSVSGSSSNNNQNINHHQHHNNSTSSLANNNGNNANNSYTNGSSSLGPPSVHSTISTNSNISTTSSSGISSGNGSGGNGGSGIHIRHSANTSTNHELASATNRNNRSGIKLNQDGPQLSEESSSSSDDDDDESSGSSSSSSSSSSGGSDASSSPSNDEGFTF